MKSFFQTAGVVGLALLTGCSYVQKSPQTFTLVQPDFLPAPGSSVARAFAMVQPPPLILTNTVTVTASVPSIIYANPDIATTNWIAVNDTVTAYLSFLDDQQQDFFIGMFSVCTNHLEWNAPDDESVIGFRIYYGVGSFTGSADAGFQTSFDLVITNPAPVIQIGATSYDAEGDESDFSNIIVRTNQIYLLRSSLRLQVSQ